jgi:hypothetical protein
MFTSPTKPAKRQPQFPQQPVAPQIQQQNASSVNQGVLQYAQSVVGRKIGNGQCTELAIAALQAAGARPNSGYTWGTQLRSVNELQPGDVVQLHDARFEYANGSWSASTGPHTAIVTSVQGSVIQVLEQNISSSPVQAGQYDVTYMTAGRIEFYRPVAGANQQAGFGGRGFPETQAGNGFQPRKLQGKTWQNALPELPRRPLFE